MIAFLLCAAAARAEKLQPFIERPLTLPQGTVDLTLQGTHTNWAAGAGLGPVPGAGESLALGADFGLKDDFYGVIDPTQIGLALALPVHPGAGFGSVLGSLVVSRSPIWALRFDGGFENFGSNQDEKAVRYFIAAGARVRARITPTIAFVMGRTGAAQFGQFTNLGANGTAEYLGSSFFTPGTSDFLVISGGSDITDGTIVGINLPVGILVQPDPHIALTLQSGYSTVILFPTGGNEAALHFLPLALEAVVTPAPAVDIGARFFVDGFVGESGGNNVSFGYFDRRALIFWVLFHIR